MVSVEFEDGNPNGVSKVEADDWWDCYRLAVGLSVQPTEDDYKEMQKITDSNVD
jgi:hypothetical protein